MMQILALVKTVKLTMLGGMLNLEISLIGLSLRQGKILGPAVEDRRSRVDTRQTCERDNYANKRQLPTGNLLCHI